jgi:hypothetical protein
MMTFGGTGETLRTRGVEGKERDGDSEHVPWLALSLLDISGGSATATFTYQLVNETPRPLPLTCTGATFLGLSDKGVVKSSAYSTVRDASPSVYRLMKARSSFNFSPVSLLSILI